jgi:hypothetical protein
MSCNALPFHIEHARWLDGYDLMGLFDSVFFSSRLMFIGFDCWLLIYLTGYIGSFRFMGFADGFVHWVSFTGFRSLGFVHWLSFTGFRSLGVVHWVATDWFVGSSDVFFFIWAIS